MQFQESRPGEFSLRNAILTAPIQSAPGGDKFVDSVGYDALLDERGDKRRRSEPRSFYMRLGEIIGTRYGATIDSAPADDCVCGRRKMSAKLYDAQEEASRRIAQRLHDDSAQVLATVYFELAEIAQESPPETAEKLSGVVKLLDNVCGQLRGLSHELRPPILDHKGLVPALRFLANGLAKRSGLEITILDSLADIPPTLHIVLYRAVQEALFNVAQHAKATKAEVSLWVERESVHCVVSDDGIGFSLSENGSAPDFGLGLVGIYERVSELGGDCAIVSCRRNITQFTELQMVIPL